MNTTLKEALCALADSASTRYPQLRQRAERAVAIILNNEWYRLDSDTLVIHGHYVTGYGTACDCLDFTRGSAPCTPGISHLCKHRLAAYMLQRLADQAFDVPEPPAPRQSHTISAAQEATLISTRLAMARAGLAFV